MGDSGGGGAGSGGGNATAPHAEVILPVACCWIGVEEAEEKRNDMQTTATIAALPLPGPPALGEAIVHSSCANGMAAAGSGVGGQHAAEGRAAHDSGSASKDAGMALMDAAPPPQTKDAEAALMGASKPHQVEGASQQHQVKDAGAAFKDASKQPQVEDAGPTPGHVFLTFRWQRPQPDCRGGAAGRGDAGVAGPAADGRAESNEDVAWSDGPGEIVIEVEAAQAAHLVLALGSLQTRTS